ncbi:hypothetical protein [Novipirellula rosea]|uniref:Uncharacterized protein n=1 Tax=Novipirellula rosea TaxID=1031540 RepID=A0ABP8NGH4_9BACT
MGKAKGNAPASERDRLITELRRAYGAWNMPEDVLLEESEGTLIRRYVVAKLMAVDSCEALKLGVKIAISLLLGVVAMIKRASKLTTIRK